MRKFLDKYIYLTPIIMLIITLYSNFMSMNYVVVGNIIGYSILTNITLFYIFNYKGVYCWFTRNIPKGLILINLIDIVGNYIDNQFYIKLFNIFVCSISLILFFIYKLKSISDD